MKDRKHLSDIYVKVAWGVKLSLKTISDFPAFLLVTLLLLVDYYAMVFITTLYSGKSSCLTKKSSSSLLKQPLLSVMSTITLFTTYMYKHVQTLPVSHFLCEHCRTDSALFGIAVSDKCYFFFFLSNSQYLLYLGATTVVFLDWGSAIILGFLGENGSTGAISNSSSFVTVASI